MADIKDASKQIRVVPPPEVKVVTPGRPTALPLPPRRLPLPTGLPPRPSATPQSFSVAKGELGSLRDGQVVKIISGWEWFMANPPTTVEEVKSMDQLRDKIQLIKFGAIGDNSCFYHSVLGTAYPPYQDSKTMITYWENDLKLRAESKEAAYPSDQPTLITRGKQLLADNFRRDIATWLLLPALKPDGQPYSEQEALAYLNSTSARVDAFLDRQRARDPMRPIFSQIDQKILKQSVEYASDGTQRDIEYEASWASDKVDGYYSFDENEAKNTVDELILTTVNGTDTFMASNVYPAIVQLREQLGEEKFFTQEGINAIQDVAVSKAGLTPELIEDILKQQGALRTGASSYKGLKIGFDRASVQQMMTEFANKVVYQSGQDVTPAESLDYLTYDSQIRQGVNTGRPADEILYNMGLLGKVGNRYQETKELKAYYDASPTLREFREYARQYIETMKAIGVTFRDSFRSPTPIQFSRYFGQILTVSQNTSLFIPLLRQSINPVPEPHFFTEEDIKALLREDPRINVIEEAKSLADTPDRLKAVETEAKVLMELPLNLNYFVMDQGRNLSRYNIQSPSVNENDIEYGLRLSTLLRYILPHYNEKARRITRRDAGITDVVTLMPFILNINIFLVKIYGNRIVVHSKYITENPQNYPTVVINWLGGHFEGVGTYETGEDGVSSIKTAFEPDHPFVIALDEYIRRRDATGGGEVKMEQTLLVNKLPEHYGPRGSAVVPIPIGVPRSGIPRPIPIPTSRGNGIPRDVGIESMMLADPTLTKEDATAIWDAEHGSRPLPRPIARVVQPPIPVKRAPIPLPRPT